MVISRRVGVYLHAEAQRVWSSYIFDAEERRIAYAGHLLMPLAASPMRGITPNTLRLCVPPCHTAVMLNTDDTEISELPSGTR